MSPTRAVRALACAAAVVVAGCGGGTRGSRHHAVEIRGLAFLPAQLQVAVGDTITWTNRDVVPHTVTASDSSWDSGQVPAGGTFVRVVARGDGYFCAYHSGMRGAVVVR